LLKAEPRPRINTDLAILPNTLVMR